MKNEPPPVPMLVEARLDAARAREKAIPFFVISKGTPPAVEPPEPEPQNPWHIVAVQLPVDATMVRPYKSVVRQPNVFVSERSRFRRGALSVGDDGFTLSGIGITPVGWFNKIGCAGYILAGLMFALSHWIPLNFSLPPLFVWLGVVGFVVGILGSIFEQVVSEARRGSQTVHVYWDKVIEAQFERDLHWAVIIYYAPDSKPGMVAHLPLNNLTPAHAVALWDAFDAYAPGRNRADTAVYDWHPKNIMLVSLLLGGLIGGISIAIYLNAHP